MPAAGLTAGAKMACWASPTANADCASPGRCGTRRTRFSKSGCSGLTGPEGNHGEDVKEEYFYLDSTPTHSYMKALYCYPQSAFPYADLVAENRRRGCHDREYELADTGIFQENRYFDVLAEYAKAGPNDILIRLTVTNRGPEAAAAARACRRCGFATPGPGAADYDDCTTKPALKLADEQDRSQLSSDFGGVYVFDRSGQPGLAAGVVIHRE